MYIVVGLGNPGKEYEHTRHNIGFEYVDMLASIYNVDIVNNKFHALIGKGNIGGENVIFVKPQTFMNLSGKSVREIVDFYDVPIDKIFVIYDDVTLDIGSVRIRARGSAGGHNGIKSIINSLGTDGFSRLKIGVGSKRNGMDLADFVLSKMSKNEIEALDNVSKDTKDIVLDFINNGVNYIMNKYNSVKY